ncbi:hypothetical protein [Ciceribacter azotifigens]|uniref:hypothetical protein n=1 Tax=Ciceribacter azotifigens TaxID=2069303 RepID=UPI003A857DB7
MSSAVTAVAVCLAFACPPLGAAARADDGRPLIWNVSKTGDRAFQFRTGIRWSSLFSPSVGADTTMTAAANGRDGSRELALRLWGSVVLGAGATASGAWQVNADAGYDPAVDRQALSLSQSSHWSATTAIDVAASRTVEASAIAGQSVGFVARQSVNVDFSDIGASIRMDGFLDGRSRAAHANLGVEKRLSRGVALSAHLSDPFRSTAATFGARVQRQW